MINPIYSPAPERYDNGMKFRRCGQSGILLPEISLRLLDFDFRMLYLCISNKKTLMINLQKNYGK